MNPNRGISKEGNDPKGAADRLGKLIDKMIKECPDATILVAMIINTCDEKQSPATKEFQKLIPDVVKSRREDGHYVLSVDFTTFKTSDLQDCIHPTNTGYKLMGDYWYSFIHQIPTSWIKNPVGSDPNRGGSGNNGGIDKNIPAPDWGKSPIQVTSKETVADAAKSAKGEKSWTACNKNPIWKGAGKIAQGNVGHNGDWKYHKNWVAKGEVAEGLGWDTRYVRLHDMNGDGKAGKLAVLVGRLLSSAVLINVIRLRLDSSQDRRDQMLAEQLAQTMVSRRQQQQHYWQWRGPGKDHLPCGKSPVILLEQLT